MKKAVEKKSDPEQVGKRLRGLRLRCRISMRQLAEKAGVSASYVSAVECGRISPTIITLRKLLVALGTDIGTFFTGEIAAINGHVIRRETMRTISDSGRCYILVLPRRPDIQFELLDEELHPGERPEFETMPSDVAGYVLRGSLHLEVGDETPQSLREGDAFYVPAGHAVRGFAAGSKPARLITIEIPPKY